MNCRKCGNPLNKNATVCPVCGEPVLNSQNKQSMNGLQLDALNNNHKNHKKGIDLGIGKPNNMPSGQFNSPINPNNNGPKGFVNQVPKKPEIMPMPMVQPKQTAKKTFKVDNKINTKFILAGVVLILAIVGGFTAVYFKKIKSNGNSVEVIEADKEFKPHQETEEERQEKLSKNVHLANNMKLYDGSLLFEYENNNDVVIEVDMKIKLYDDETNLVKEIEHSEFASNYTKFLFLVRNDEINVPYTNYEIEYKVYETKYKGVKVDITKLENEVTNDTIKATYTPSDGEKLDDLRVCIIYYDNETIAGVDCKEEKKIAYPNPVVFDFDFKTKMDSGKLKFDTYKYAVTGYNEGE